MAAVSYTIKKSIHQTVLKIFVVDMDGRMTSLPMCVLFTPPAKDAAFGSLLTARVRTSIDEPIDVTMSLIEHN